jgi:hypothetical protein
MEENVAASAFACNLQVKYFHFESMSSVDVSSEPSLAPPGAGLPRPELWIARWLFGRACRRTSAEEARRLMAVEQKWILKRVGAVPASQLGERVLIPRPRGLEDSSRYWSILMTLEHLRIVNEAVAAVIGELLAGEVRPRATGTAEVKPSPAVGRDVLERFPESCERVLEAVGERESLPSDPRYAHPWFGPMGPDRWLVLVPFHLRLHRRQIEAIAERLPS